MDAMRKQLDVLMGANRNGDVREVNRKYYDRDVCRLYLSGLCPHELFQLTVLLSIFRYRFFDFFSLYYLLVIMILFVLSSTNLCFHYMIFFIKLQLRERSIWFVEW